MIADTGFAGRPFHRGMTMRFRFGSAHRRRVCEHPLVRRIRVRFSTQWEISLACVAVWDSSNGARRLEGNADDHFGIMTEITGQENHRGNSERIF